MKNLKMLSVMMLSVLSLSLLASDSSTVAAGSGQAMATAQAAGMGSGSFMSGMAARRAARREKLNANSKVQAYETAHPNAQTNFAAKEQAFQAKKAAMMANGGPSAAMASAQANGAGANASASMAAAQAANSGDSSGQ